MPVIDVLAWELVANTKGLIAGVGAAQSKLKALSAGAGATVGAVAALGAAMVVAGARAAKMAAELDTALAKVSTLLPETTAELGDLREQIVALSTRVPQTPVQLTEALYQAISAGARDTAEALFLVEQASKAAVAGQSDTETATRAISSVLNAYQLDISEATRVSDVFFKTIEQGVIEFPDIAANIGEISGTAALAGVSIEEVGAAMAAMTKNGIGAAEATTALNRFLLAAIKPTDDMAQTAQELGVDLSAAGIEAHGLVGVMQQMEEAAGGDIETLAELNPNIRAARAAFVLAGKGGEDFRQILEELQGSAGSTEEAFGKMLNTAGNLTEIIGNKMNVAFFELGEPILRGLVIPSLQLVNALLPELGVSAGDFAGEIRRINNELTQLQRVGVTLRGLGEIFSPRILNELAELIVPGGDIGFEDLRRAFSGAAEEGLAAADIDRIVAIPDLEERLAEINRAIDFVVQEAAAATSDAAAERLAQQFGVLERLLEQTERQIAARAEDAGEEVGKGVAKGLDTSNKLIRDALKLIEEGFDQLLTDPEADLDAFADTAKINAFRRELERVAGEFDHAGERALAVQGLLDEWELELDDLPPILRTIVSGMTDVGEVSERTRESARRVVQDIGAAARSTAELAEAFGLVGDGAGQVVSQLDLIAQGVTGVLDQLANPEATFASFLGPIGTAVGGLAGLAGAIFGGPSPEAQAAMASRERNTRQLERLSNDIDRLREAMFDLPGQLASDLSAALDEGLEGERSSIGDITLFDEDIRRLRGALDDMGITISDIERAAGNLEVDQLLRLMEGQVLKGAEVVEAFEQANSLAEKLAQDTTDFFDTVAGRMEQAQRRIDVFDISDPVAQIEEFIKVIQESGVALSDADLARLREGDSEFIGELIGELETGTGRFAGAADLGEFSRQELIDLLVDIESIGDRIGEATTGITNFFDTLAGRLDIARRRIERFDITDPLDQIAEFVKVIEESGVGLTAAETERLRRGDEDFINELIDQLEAGTGRFGEGTDALGDFSRRELIDILSTIESIGDQVEAPGGGREGFTESFQTFNRITAVQGSAIIAQLSSGNFFLRQIAENTAALLNGGAQIQPVAPPSIPGTTQVEVVGGTLNGTVAADSVIGQEIEALRSGAGFPDVRF